jgi:uncharacterized membrane protein YdbT with pleckstrin-like domain
MSYMTRQLLPGERIVCTASIHWIVYVPSLIPLLLCAYLLIAHRSVKFAVYTATALGLYGLYRLARALIVTMTTELGVTNRRVVAKIGLIRRETIELNHSKVESFNVLQTILGRILGYGTLVVTGTGGTSMAVPIISRPMAFRREAMLECDSSQRN